MKETAAHLLDTMHQALPLLRRIDENSASHRPYRGKWSPKEIIGHLIDSAGNNQQKFVRCMEHDGLIFPNYEQNYWVSVQKYNDENWEQLLALWEMFNCHLAHVISCIPTISNSNRITIGHSGPFTLEYIVNDYPEHLKHHLKQILPDAGFLQNSFKMVY